MVHSESESTLEQTLEGVSKYSVRDSAAEVFMGYVMPVTMGVTGYLLTKDLRSASACMMFTSFAASTIAEGGEGIEREGYKHTFRAGLATWAASFIGYSLAD